MRNANKIIETLKEIFNLSTDIGLAEKLNISPTTLSTWKSRNSLDYKMIINLCEEHEIDLNYLFLGITENQERANSLESLIELITKRVRNDISKELQTVQSTQEVLYDLLEKEEVKRRIEEAKSKAQKKELNIKKSR